MTAPASRRCVLGAARIASAGALLLAGCQTTMLPTVAKVDMPETPVVRPYAQPVPVRANGSIYQASQYRPLFEDHRARLVGDTITVQIIERVSASSNSTSTVEKKGELSGSITALPMAATRFASSEMIRVSRKVSIGIKETSSTGARSMLMPTEISFPPMV